MRLKLKSIFVGTETVLALTFQHIVKNKLADELGLFGGIQFDVLDLAADITLFTGQEKVGVTAAVDECFPFQPLKTGLNGFAQRETVCIDLVEAEGYKVIDIASDFIDIADEKKHFEELRVEVLQTLVFSGLVDSAFDGGVEEALNGRVETV